MKQAVTHAVVAHDRLIYMKKTHNPLDQSCARKNDIRSLGLQAVDLFTLRNCFALVKCDLAPNLAQSQVAAMNFSMCIANQFFFHRGKGRKGPGDSYKGQDGTIFRPLMRQQGKLPLNDESHLLALFLAYGITVEKLFGESYRPDIDANGLGNSPLAAPNKFRTPAANVDNQQFPPVERKSPLNR